MSSKVVKRLLDGIWQAFCLDVGHSFSRMACHCALSPQFHRSRAQRANKLFGRRRWVLLLYTTRHTVFFLPELVVSRCPPPPPPRSLLSRV